METDSAQYNRSCPNCGATVGANANFCGSCAAPIDRHLVNRPSGRKVLLAVSVLLSVVIVAAALYLLVFFRGGSNSSGPGLVGPFKSDTSEAEAFVRKAFEKIYTKCGDSYFGNTLGLREYKGVEFTVKKIDLSDADRLNGIEWKGIVSISFKLTRSYNTLTRKWDDWGSSENPFLSGFAALPGPFQIERRKGKWGGVNLSLPSVPSSQKKATCDDIPGENPSEAEEQQAAAQLARREAESQRPTKTIAEYENVADHYKGTVGNVKLTDVDVSFSENGRQVNVWFGLIKSIEPMNNINPGYGGGYWYYTHIRFKRFDQNRQGASIEMNQATERDRFLRDLQDAVNAWREKFSDIP